MAFDPSRLQQLSSVSGAEGTRLWKYTHTDSLVTITASGYFDEGGGDSVFNIGDLIFVIVVDDLINVDRTSAEICVITITGI